MRIAAATSWGAVSAEVDDTATADILVRAFQCIRAEPGALDAAPTVARVSAATRVGTVVVSTDGATCTCSVGMPAALTVATEFNRVLLQTCPYLAVHAAVLATHDGVLAMPAESGTGKSTLTAACLRRGFRYVSDEALVIRADGAVIAYPRPLGLSRWSRGAVQITSVPGFGPVTNGDDDEELIDPACLGDVASDLRDVPLRAVISLRRGADLAGLARLPRAQGAIALLRNSFNHFKDPAASVALVHDVVSDAEVLELVLGEPMRAADVLADHFGLPT